MLLASKSKAPGSKIIVSSNLEVREGAQNSDRHSLMVIENLTCPAVMMLYEDEDDALSVDLTTEKFVFNLIFQLHATFNINEYQVYYEKVTTILKVPLITLKTFYSDRSKKEWNYKMYEYKKFQL